MMPDKVELDEFQELNDNTLTRLEINMGSDQVILTRSPAKNQKKSPARGRNLTTKPPPGNTKERRKLINYSPP